MEWLLIAALAAWVYVQGQGLKTLRERLDRLEPRALVSRPSPQEASYTVTTPLPAVGIKPEPQPERQVSPTIRNEPADPDPPRPEVSPAKLPGRSAVAWISEHGLAWLGGGALALGGLFLVAYAAQRGVFTPALRIAAAIAAGFLMIAASEWVRRKLLSSETRQTPAAALLAGAGAATLYGAVWASDRLYGFIDLPVSAPLLALTSAGLLALAFIHGFPLAIAALFGAYLAPLVTDGPDWGDGPLTAYLILILLTGYAAAALRRWTYAAWAASAGAVIWALANRGDGAGVPSVLLLALSPAAIIAVSLWRRAREPNADDLTRMTTAGVLLASVVGSFVMWLGTTLHPVQAATLFATLLGLGALAAARRLIPAPVQIAAYAMPVIALMVLEFVSPQGLDERHVAFSGLGIAIALFAAAFGATASAVTTTARWSAAAGAAAAALLLALLTSELGHIHSSLGWGAPAVGAAMLAWGAAWFGRRSADPDSDLGLAVWIWSAMFLAARALGEGLDTLHLPAGVAALGLMAAVLHVRLSWRGFAASAIAAALTVLASFAFGVAPIALTETVGPWLIAAAFGVPSALLLAAGYVVHQRGARAGDLADGLGMAAMVGALMGGFILLRMWAQASGGGAQGLDRLTEAAFGVLLLLVGGLVSAKRDGAEPGRLAKFRPHVFLCVGLAYAVLGAGLGLNPLWSAAAVPIKGPPLFDGLALAYLAPAVLLSVATRRRVSTHLGLLGAYAAGALFFAVLWIGLEIRRLFQGATLDGGLDVVGRAEAAAYGLAVLVIARAVMWIAREARSRSWTISPISMQVQWVATSLTWVAFAIATLVFAFAASPWWGPIIRPFQDTSAVMLLLVLYAVGTAAWLSFSVDSVIGRVARAATALQAFILVTLVVRFAFRGLDMHPELAGARMETWTFSAVWALYGVAVLVIGARREDIVLRWTGLGLLLATTAKVFLFDMARLDGMVRAGSFLALGALLIVAALAARRFGTLSFGAVREEARPPA